MSIIPDLRAPGHEVWVTLVLFVCLLLFVWVRIINPQKIPAVVKGFFRVGTMDEKNITPDSIALFFIFICSSALFATMLFKFHAFRTHFSNVQEFFFFFLLLIIYYLLKIMVILFCGAIFGVQSNARDYINEIFTSTHLAALGLLPSVIILTFVNSMNEALVEKCILAIIALFLLYRTIKMFILMMNRGLSVIYLILYLCTLEIIPLVLLFEYRNAINF